MPFLSALGEMTARSLESDEWGQPKPNSSNLTRAQGNRARVPCPVASSLHTTLLHKHPNLSHTLGAVVATTDAYQLVPRQVS